jgi:RES domain-containing protein
LEIILQCVHIAAPALPLNRYLVQIDVPTMLWRKATVLESTRLVGWDALPASKTSIEWGTAWVRSNSELLVLVPSVIVPEETNVLINPLHPDIAKLKAAKVRKWLYDPRALGLPLL